MISVFYCTMGSPDPLRESMSRLCRERWALEKGIHFQRLTPVTIDCAPSDFQRSRRIWADEHADSPIYVVADDDCLLGPDSPIGEMVSLLDRHREFAMLSSTPSNCKIGPWTPEDYEPYMSPTIWEHVSVGHIRYCRKGMLKEWPIQTRKGYDTEQCEQIRKEGKRSGYAIQVKHNHLGEGLSTIWQ